MNIKKFSQLWKTVWQFLKKVNIFLTYDPATMLLGIDPNELKTYENLQWIIHNCQNLEATTMSFKR